MAGLSDVLVIGGVGLGAMLVLSAVKSGVTSPTPGDVGLIKGPSIGGQPAPGFRIDPNPFAINQDPNKPFGDITWQPPGFLSGLFSSIGDLFSGKGTTPSSNYAGGNLDQHDRMR